MYQLFGFGFQADYKDNATQGLYRTLNALESLNMAGFSLSKMGDDLIRFGAGIFNATKKATGALIEANSMMDTIGAQFKTVFGEQAQKALDWAADFSIKTPFTIDQTARSMSGLKAVGVDVTKTFKAANGEMKPFLQFVGDLSTRNMTATGGIQGMMTALSNAVGGQWRSLQQRFDIPKTYLDQLKSAYDQGTESFLQAFVDLSNKLTPNAMQNMIGTWEQIIAEMEDTWTVFLWTVGKTGVFDNFKKTLNDIRIAFAGIAGDPKTIKALSTFFNSIWQPINSVVQSIIKLAYWFRDLLANNPELASWISKVTVFIVALTVGSGILFKFAGGLLLIANNIFTVILIMKEFGGIMNLLKISYMSMFSFLLPFGLLAAAIFYLWKTRTKEFAQFLEKAKWAVIILADALGDDKISEKNFQKMNELGLKPLVETVLDFKARLGDLVNGFMTGVGKMVDKTLDFLNYFGGLSNIVDTFVKGISQADSSQWEKLGEMLSYVAAGLLLLTVLVPVINFIMSIVGAFQGLYAAIVAIASSGAVAAVLGFFSEIGFAIASVAGGAATIGEALAFVGEAFVALIGGPVTLIIAAIVAVIAIIVGLWNTNEGFRNAVISMWTDIKDTFIIVWNYISIAFTAVVEVLKSVWSVFGDNLIFIFKNTWDIIGNVLTGVVDVIGGVFKLIKGLLTGDWATAWEGAKKVVVGVVEVIWAIMKGFLNNAINGINALIKGLNFISFNVPDWVPVIGGKNIKIDIPTIPQLNTGGAILSDGMAMLHKNEVVVNDPTTKKLNRFLNDGTTSSRPTTVTQDNRIIFEQGSLVVQVENGNEQDAEAFTDKVMVLIERKQQLKRIMQYKPAF